MGDVLHNIFLGMPYVGLLFIGAALFGVLLDMYPKVFWPLFGLSAFLVLSYMAGVIYQ